MLRVSLRVLLVCVAIIAALAASFAWKVRRAEEIRAVVANIAQKGGVVRYDWEVTKDGEITENGLLLSLEKDPPGPRWLRDRLGENLFSQVVSLEFNLMRARGDLSGLAYASDLPNLKHLYIGWLGGDTSQLVHLEYLADLQGLESLTLEHLGLNDTHLIPIRSMQRLKRLRLNGNSISDRGLRNISHLACLQELGLHSNELTGQGLRNLSHLKDLRMLDLGANRLRASGLVYLRDMRNLEWLSLEYAHVTDDALSDLACLKNLRYLNLSDTPISDEGLPHLDGLTLLESIDLTNTRVTAVGATELKRRLPNLAKTIGVTMRAIASKTERQDEQEGIGALSECAGDAMEDAPREEEITQEEMAEQSRTAWQQEFAEYLKSGKE